MIQSLREQFQKKDGDAVHSLILPAKDERVVFVSKIVNRIKEACVYFSPECEEYLNHLKIIVVEDDTVNAYTTMGGEREDE